MNNEQTYHKLNESILSLETNLDAYLKTKHAKTQRYTIKREQTEIKRTLELLKDQLAGLVHLTEQ